jgi:hypothetical protein
MKVHKGFRFRVSGFGEDLVIKVHKGWGVFALLL